MLAQRLERLGRFAASRPWVVVGSWLLVVAGVLAASSAYGHKLDDSFHVPGLDSEQAQQLLAKAGAGQDGLTAVVVVTPKDRRTTFFASAPARAALRELEDGAAALPKVLATTDPAGALGAGPAAAARSGVVSPDGRVALVRLQYPTLDHLSSADLANLESLGARARVHSPLRIEMGGDLFFAFASPPTGLGEAIGLLAALVVLLLAFGSLVAAALPIGTAVLGLAVGVGSIGLLANVVGVPSYAPVLGSMVGLGVGIDYALFLVTRHRDHLARGVPVVEAAGRALATAGQPVVFAGGIVVVSILGLAVAGVPFMTAGGIAIAVVVLVMVVASMTLLPAFLGLAGRRVQRRRDRRRPAAAGPSGGTFWQRWVGHVTRHATGYAVGVTALLLAAAAPVLAMRVGIPDDGSLPTTRTERRAYDLVAVGFGPGRNGPLVVAVDLHHDDAAVGALVAGIRADRGIAALGPVAVDARQDLATIVAYATTGPQEQATYDTVERLRDRVFPLVLADSPARAHVGGQAANFADVGARVNARLPLFVLAVLGLSALLLLLVFRSVVVALKAVLLNALSIGASFGVMVMVFQWGWGADLIGLHSTVPIVSFIPMFMFAILFGLSMDYEVFLLSRVREEYVTAGDNDKAVVTGIARTGRVITSAALIMVCVFLSFVLGQDAATKMFGLGLATAVLVDATLVRMVLVPAVMKLAGPANWWLPRWLDGRLPRVDVVHEPAPEPVHA